MLETSKNHQGKHAEYKPTKPKIWDRAGRLALRNFNSHMGKIGAVAGEYPYDEKIVLGTRTGLELIRNDGSVTYLVHSTTPEKAKHIMANGLAFNGDFYDATKPALRETALMLAAGDEPAAEARNLHMLAYRYEGQGDEECSVKMVFKFNDHNPGTSNNVDPFEDTYLDHADGEHIQQVSSEGDGRYVITPDHLMGHFDFDTDTPEHFIPFEQPSPADVPIGPAS